jgi:hypothetical protein
MPRLVFIGEVLPRPHCPAEGNPHARVAREQELAVREAAGLAAAEAAQRDLCVQDVDVDDADEAARRGGRGSRERVFRALLAHPLVGQVEVAEKLADRMIDSNREYLAWAR